MKRTLIGLAACLLAGCNPISNSLVLGPDPGSAPVTSPSSPATTPTAAPTDRIQGESKTFMNQTVNSWAKVNGDTIEEAGFSLPLALVEATSTDKASAPFSIKLEMPDQIISKTVLNHVSLDYIAGGHPPPGVYDVPHFDVHFYFNSQSAQAAVDCADKTLPAADRMAPPYMFFPPDAPECVLTMGYHASDPRSPELAQQNPAKFDKTLIMGYYNGKQNFIEPMLTREFLLKKEGFTMDVLKPAVVDKAGLYPSKAEMRFNATSKMYELVLKDFK